MLLVSPERLNNPDFRDQVLPRLAASAGHARGRRGALRLRLGPRLPARLPAAAHAASPSCPPASRCSPPPPPPTTGWSPTSPSSCGARRPATPLVLRGALDRESLRLSVVRLPTPAQRLAWLAGPLDELPGSGIIYTLTVAAAEEVAAFLRERGHRGRRLHRQDRARRAARGRGRSAGQPGQGAGGHQRAGHGLRQARPRVRRAPRRARRRPSPTTSRSAGRAGRRARRGGAAARPRGPRHLGATSPRSRSRRSRWCGRRSRVLSAAEPLSTAALEPRVDLSPHPAGDDAQGARRRRRRQPRQGRLGRPPGSRGRTTASATARIAEARARRAAGDARLHRHHRVPHGVPAPPARRPDAAPCGRCDNCTGPVWSRRRGDADAARRRARRLDRPGVEVAPRSQWPSGMAELGVPVSGRIPAGEQAETGRVIGRLSDIGWGARLRELVAGRAASAGRGAGDSWSSGGAERLSADAVPKDVLDACVRVLAGWGWAERPVGVVGIGSRTRPHQLAHLARRIAEIGRLPLLGTLAPQGRGLVEHANSAQRLAAVWTRVRRAAFAVPAGPGAARRRRDRHRLDDDGGRAHPAPGGGERRAAVRPGCGGLISAGARPVHRPPA